MPGHGQRLRRVARDRSREPEGTSNGRAASPLAARPSGRRALRKGDERRWNLVDPQENRGVGSARRGARVADSGARCRRRSGRRRRPGHRDYIHHPRCSPGDTGPGRRVRRSHPAAGAGTVTTPRAGGASAEAGATFLVSPGCDPDLLPVMIRPGSLVLPAPSPLPRSCSPVGRRAGGESCSRAPLADRPTPEGPSWSFSRLPLRANGRRLLGNATTGSRPAPSRWEPGGPGPHRRSIVSTAAN